MSIKSIASTFLLFVIIATSCVREPSISYNEIEQRSLKAWIEKYHPELNKNYQTDGGYYVEVLDYGCQDSVAITGKDVWVWFDLTARDLHGNIYETRSATIAEQLATYNDHAHYVPAIRFSGKDSHTLMEGTYLATFNKLKIGDEEVEVRYGTKLRLYLPSSVTGSTVTTADGGYEGQFSADESKPMIVDMTIYGHVTNPVEYEGERVNGFAEDNGGLCTKHKAVVEEPETNSTYLRYISRNDESQNKEDEEANERVMEFYDGRWHQPVDTLEQLLVKYLYSPKSTPLLFNDLSEEKYPNEGRYRAGRVYNNSDIDNLINTALVKRFGKGMTIEELPEADSLKVKTEAKIWYVGRFLDGFIFDTNIDEVKEIIYGKVDSKGEALKFDPKKPLENKYILAWNYALPTLRYGQWAAILTVSTYGYGISGQVGSHTTTTNYSDAYYDYANYYNYMNYMNNYYGYGYGNMYNNGYYGYDPYYYGYNYNLTENDVTTTSTTSTEIPAYSPLLFQVFVEK